MSIRKSFVNKSLVKIKKEKGVKIKMEWLWNLDANILLFLQEHARTPILTEFLQFYTNLGNAGFLAILTCVLLLAIPKMRKIGLAASISLLAEFILVNLILKNAVARARPYEIIEGLTCITKLATDFSFPSGHTGSCFAVAVVLFLELPKRYGITALFLAVLMAYSRLYVGVHYPTDVLAALLIGTLTAVITCRFFLHRNKTEKQNRESL